MDLKAQFIQALLQAKDPLNKKSSEFLSEPGSENDAAEIISFLEAIFETAVEQGNIEVKHQATIEKNLATVKELLHGKTTVPYFKEDIAELTPNELLQSLMFFSDADRKNISELTSRASEPFIEVTANGSEPIYFLYTQLSGKDRFYDRYINRKLPVNGDSRFCQYDDYWPLYKLMEKYFPGNAIRLTADSTVAEGKYIYVISFRHFPDYAEKNKGNLLSVIPDYILNDTRAGKAIIIYNDLAESMYYPPIIKEFQNQVNEAGLINSFFLLSGDWANKPLEKHESSMQSNTRFLNEAEQAVNLFVINYFEEAMAYSKQTSFADYTFHTRLDIIKNHAGALKHFICLNRIVKDYRVYLSWYFFNNNLLNKAFVSQGKFSGYDDLQFGYNKNIALLKSAEGPLFEEFKQSLPWTVDAQHSRSLIWDEVPMSALNQSFCWVVTETSFEDTLPDMIFRPTEKTYKPIAFFMPFIMVSNPFHLEMLRKSGYRTFSKWWDEGYDSVIDPIDRMEKITTLIGELSKWSRQDLIKAYEEMEDVLIHNYKVLISSKSGKPAMEAIYKNYKNRL